MRKSRPFCNRLACLCFISALLVGYIMLISYLHELQRRYILRKDRRHELNQLLLLPSDADGAISRRPLYQISSYLLSIDQYKTSIPGLLYGYSSRSDSRQVGRENSRYSDEVTYYPLGDLLSAWNPDDTSPSSWMQSRCHPLHGDGPSIRRFNYSVLSERKAAQSYREHEQPFIVHSISELDNAITTSFSYYPLLSHMSNRKRTSVERLESNKYMYYHKPGAVQPNGELYSDWQPPQQDVHMSFGDFLREAETADASPHANASVSLLYLTLSAIEGQHTPWLMEALPFFGPRPSFFVVDTSDYKGINCRFGMRGVAAAAHYDGKRNFIAMLRGRKRYIILPPSECRSLELYPRAHPSARHSSVDWANLTQVRMFPNLYAAKAIEVVLVMGEVLYLPGGWFHYIVSQDASIQCNTRSGPAIHFKNKDVCSFRSD